MGQVPVSEFADEYQDWLAEQPEGRRAQWFDFPVGEVERGPLLRVAPSDSLAQVVTLMNEYHRGAVLVVEDDRLVGIFTERDVLRRVVMQHLDLAKVTVGELMTRDPDVLPESATLAQALREMVQGGYRHLPIVDARGRPTSMLSMRTIIEFVSEAFPKEVWNAPPEKNRPSRTSDGG
jgi:CBS domain-containing protein